MEELIKLSTEQLLKKFGAGSHKPGSGSAAALQGMLSAKLVQTVIDLTIEKPKYDQYLSSLNDIREKIENRTYPELSQLFQLDSEQFDRVITLRRERKNEKNPSKRMKVIQDLNEVLMLATETPINIAKLCVEVSEFALFLFDEGFQSARGDSGVALNNAVSAIAGCLSIVNLNLLSLGDDDQTNEIRIEAEILKIRYLELFAEANNRLTILEKESERHREYQKELQQLTSDKWVNDNLSYEEIEQFVRRLQNTLWLYHDKISKQPAPDNLIEILKPEVVLEKILGYQYNTLDSLGQYVSEEGLFEIAGIIDKERRYVSVSQNFSKETQNFTAAHELGHAFLHKQTVLHRDKAIDGSVGGGTREKVELEADKFATYFLMPKKLVQGLFKHLFLTDKFILNEGTVLALTGERLSDFKRKCRNTRDLSRFLASTEFYSTASFKSMAEIFGVSKETMAIRLEELELIEY